MLTAKQEKFVQNIIKGMTQADAYRDAYDTKRMTDKSIHEAASKLVNNTKVATRLEELRSTLANENIMTAKQRLEWLTSIVRDDATNIDARLRAADIMNKMQGEYVQKVEAEVTKEVTINIELCEDE